MAQEEEDSVLGISRKFGENTSSHGIPRIVAAKSYFGKIFWSCLYVASLAAFTWQAYVLIDTYFKFEVSIKYVVENSDARIVQFPAVTLCNTNQVRRSVLALRHEHEILSSIEDYTNGLQYYAPCKAGDFHCENNKCVKDYRECNGIDDCGDKSDEQNCQSVPCRSGYKRCQMGGESGYCISEDRWCDRNIDCYDGEDEVCTANDIKCKDDEFSCKSGVEASFETEYVEKYGTKYCISAKLKCDGIKHCQNNADEDNCPAGQCNGTDFTCGDSICIPNDYKCDGFCDCADCRDESSDTLCAFTCTNGKQIPKEETCDYKNQCGDNSDEEGCTEFPSCTEEFEFQCDNKQCIVQANICNDIEDCFDYSDERSCNCSRFLCNNKKCVNIYADCNGLDECGDGSDEMFCNDTESHYQTHDPSNWTDDWYFQYADKLDIGSDTYLLETAVKLFKENFKDWGFERVLGEFPPDWIRFLVFSSTADYSDLQNVLKLTQEELSELGHQASQMILQCTYGGTKCDIEKDFHLFQHDKYGNCYTFNSHKMENATKYDVSQPGAEKGLKLTLYTEQHEYVSIFGQESGIKVSVHNQFETPFPEENAITVSPGRATSLGIKKHELIRKGQPYGNCTSENATVKNLIYKGDTVYTATACQKSCLQLKLIEVCDCVDTLRYNGSRRCELLDLEQERCRQFVNYLHSQYLIKCDCPVACREITYEKTVSQSLWPSDRYVKTLLDSIYVLEPRYSEHLYDLETAQRNLARVNVYYEDLSYVSISELPAYTWQSLFGDVGGTLGLYIGLSLLTVVEFCEFFIDILLYCCNKMVKRNKVQSISGM